MTNIVQPQIIEINSLYNVHPCVGCEVCDKYTSQFRRRMLGKYVGEGKTFDKQLESAILDVQEFEHEEYLRQVRSIHKGAALRQSRKSDRQGLTVDQFVWKNHIPDIVEINSSLDKRSGGVMTKAYQRTIEEMGGVPTKLRELTKPKCYAHCIWDWGVFEPIEGYMQGEIEVGRKLVAYIRLKRQGNLGIYTTILGHGDYLQYGVMYRLHFAIMEWLGASGSINLPALDYILYGTVDSGNSGLQMWKKRCLFKPSRLIMHS